MEGEECMRSHPHHQIQSIMIKKVNSRLRRACDPAYQTDLNASSYAAPMHCAIVRDPLSNAHDGPMLLFLVAKRHMFLHCLVPHCLHFLLLFVLRQGSADRSMIFVP